MKKAIAKLATGLFIEMPLAAAVAHIGVRVRQLAENHTDDEIKAKLLERFGPKLMPLILGFAKLREAQETSTATGQRAANRDHATKLANQRAAAYREQHTGGTGSTSGGGGGNGGNGGYGASWGGSL